MTMNDPRMTDRRIDPSMDSPRRDNTMGWVGGIIAVLVVIGLIWWAVEANRTNTASNPSSQTTGQSTPAPSNAPAR